MGITGRLAAPVVLTVLVACGGAGLVDPIPEGIDAPAANAPSTATGESPAPPDDPAPPADRGVPPAPTSTTPPAPTSTTPPIVPPGNPPPTPAPFLGKRVFVTSETFGANLQGLDGGDQRCQAAAQGAGLGGTWNAWLSGVLEAARDHVSGSGPWYLVDKKTLVFASRAQLGGEPSHAIDMDEHGLTIAANANGWVWTGTREGGVQAGLAHCAGWSNTLPLVEGAIGIASSAKNWTWGTTRSCGGVTAASLYCFEH
jgi:hypothetical protein